MSLYDRISSVAKLIINIYISVSYHNGIMIKDIYLLNFCHLTLNVSRRGRLGDSVNYIWQASLMGWLNQFKPNVCIDVEHIDLQSGAGMRQWKHVY